MFEYQQLDLPQLKIRTNFFDSQGTPRLIKTQSLNITRNSAGNVPRTFLEISLESTQ